MSKAWHYSDGKWVLGDDPVTDALLASQADERTDAVLRKLGYMDMIRVGQPWRAGFVLWEREEDGSALIITGVDEDTRFFYVAAAPDARDICARWAALARDKTINDVFDDLTGNETDLEITKDAIRTIKSFLRNRE